MYQTTYTHTLYSRRDGRQWKSVWIPWYKVVCVVYLQIRVYLNALTGTLKLESNGPNAVIGRLNGETTVLKLGGRAPRGVRVPIPRNFFDFLSENGEFWCILGGASTLYVIQSYCTREWDRRGRKRKSPGEGRHSALIGERPIHQILYFHLCWK